MKKILIIWAVLFLGGTMSGYAQQDFHFSQFNASPLNVNPALAGLYHGNYRLVSNYRTQWYSVSEPFVTSGASLDIPLVINLWKADFFAAGFSVYQDKLGDSRLTSTKFDLTLSYSKALDFAEKHFFSVGFQGGYNNRAVSYDQLYWDEQWVGEGFRITLPSREANQPTDVGAHFDMGLGIHYYFSNKELFKFKTGLAMYHVNRPNITLFGQEFTQNRKYIYTIGFEHGIRPNSHFVVSPNIYYMDQGPASIFMAGTDFLFILKDATEYTGFLKEVSFGLGGYYRLNDALIPRMQLNLGGLRLGFSYDLNVSRLNVATGTTGGPEFSLIYQGGFKKGHKGGHSSDRFK